MTGLQLPSKKTKIVCTIGPASESRETLERMIRGGMNVARLNFAHGDLESHRRVIENVRAAARTVGQRVTIMGDLPGPKMRIGRLAEESVELERGQSFILQAEEVRGDSRRASLNFSGLPKAVTPGDKIFVNDGFIELEVREVRGQQVHCQVMVGGELRSHKGVNLPGIDLGISAFTDHDRQFLEFACEQGLDAIGQSFVQDAGDIKAVRAAAASLNYRPFIIAKIERSRAVENLDAILESTDGIMVARGDLGVEIPIEEIALAQKHIIRRANLFGRPVITATQMLESMVNHRRPTRAEATDVANAILDGTDCVMLSGETAAGSYPIEAVAVMARIASVTEPHCSSGDVAQLLESDKAREKISEDDLISLTIHLSVDTLSPEAVVTPTLSGATARRVSRFRLPVWIVAVSPDELTCQGLQFSYGVYPVHETVRPTSWERYARDWLAKRGLDTNLALLTLGAGTGHTGGTNQIAIVDLEGPFVETSIW
jgi:pyruvate kinase